MQIKQWVMVPVLQPPSIRGRLLESCQMAKQFGTKFFIPSEDCPSNVSIFARTHCPAVSSPLGSTEQTADLFGVQWQGSVEESTSVPADWRSALQSTGRFNFAPIGAGPDGPTIEDIGKNIVHKHKMDVNPCVSAQFLQEKQEHLLQTCAEWSNLCPEMNNTPLPHVEILKFVRLVSTAFDKIGMKTLTSVYHNWSDESATDFALATGLSKEALEETDASIITIMEASASWIISSEPQDINISHVTKILLAYHLTECKIDLYIRLMRGDRDLVRKLNFDVFEQSRSNREPRDVE